MCNKEKIKKHKNFTHGLLKDYILTQYMHNKKNTTQYKRDWTR